MIAAPLSAHDHGLMNLHPTAAFVPLGLECMMWQNRLTQSNLHAAHDSGTASPGVHAEALLAQQRAQGGRSRRSTHLRSLAAIAVSHSVTASQGSAQRRRLMVNYTRSLASLSESQHLSAAAVASSLSKDSHCSIWSVTEAMLSCTTHRHTSCAGVHLVSHLMLLNCPDSKVLSGCPRRCQGV